MVNNAGLGFENVRIHEMEENTWDSMMYAAIFPLCFDRSWH